MVKKVSIEGIVSTSIVTAFTIAAALIWKDVIVEIIEIFFPSSENCILPLFWERLYCSVCWLWCWC